VTHKQVIIIIININININIIIIIIIIIKINILHTTEKIYQRANINFVYFCIKLA
jgi:hypothetical protein